MIKNFEQLKEKIDRADVISFDIFDTLLIRLCSRPEDVFAILERTTGIKGLAKVRQDLQQKASIEAERVKRKAHADFYDIYDYIARHDPFKGNKDEAKTGKQVDAAEPLDKKIDWTKVEETELEIERTLLEANPEILPVYDYALKSGKRVVAVSDMYLTKDFIADVLKAKGFHDISAIYVSSDVNRTKFRGDIFDEVASREGVSGEKILHIGDNEESDGTLAEKAGWQTWLYQSDILEQLPEKSGKYSDAFFDTGIARAVLAKKEYADQHQTTPNRTDCSRNNPDVDSSDFWYRLGLYVGGPLYSGFYPWLKSKAADYDSVFLLARDGYNLSQIDRKFGKGSWKYVLTSRRALLLTGVTGLDEETLRLLPPFTRGQKLCDVLAYLGVLEACRPHLEEAGFQSEEDIIKDDFDIERAKKLYQLSEEAFLQVCEKERERAAAYYKSLGFPAENALLFDSGWKGSSQFLLQRFLKADGDGRKFPFAYAGILTSVTSLTQLRGLPYSTYLFGPDHDKELGERLKAALEVLELFFGAPDKAVFCYTDDGVRMEDLGNDESYKKSICRGILDYLEYFLPLADKFKLFLKPEDAAGPVLRLMEEPLAEEGEEIGSLTNVDGFVYIKGADRQIAGGKNWENVHWVPGFLARRDIPEDIKEKAREKFLGTADKLTSEATRAPKADSDEKKVHSFESDKEAYGLSTAREIRKKNPNRTNDDDAKYDYWMRNFEPKLWKNGPLSYRPAFSIVVPVYNVADDQLMACIESVLAQTYDNYKLILVDDCSTWPSVRTILKSYEERERVQVIYREKNGNISEATNTGIEAADGDFLVFSDCDDVLSPHALYELAVKLNKNPELDFIYSDEDKLTEDGSRRHMPFFKPDWSPDTFWSIMYTNHISAFRKSVVDETGPLRTEFNGAQDYDFLLRFMEHSKNSRVGHISKVLYHWRERPESIASSPKAKDYALEAMRKLKEEGLKRRGIAGRTEYIPDMFQYRVVYDRRPGDRVSIIIVTNGDTKAVRRCISSIESCTGKNDYELILVERGSRTETGSHSDHGNQSDGENLSGTEMQAGFPDSIAGLAEEKEAVYLSLADNTGYFAACNAGAAKAKYDILLFLQDDIEVMMPGWLDRMAGHAIQDHTGAVGAKLLYPESLQIQHDGLVGLSSGPAHILSGKEDGVIYYFGRNRAEYNWLAVSGSCLMVEKRKFSRAGGFCRELPDTYGDVDLCMRLAESGLYNVVRNDVVHLHYEPDPKETEKKGKKAKAAEGRNEKENVASPDAMRMGTIPVGSVSRAECKAEKEILFRRHPAFRAKDPWYSANLADDSLAFDLRIGDNDSYCHRLARADRYFSRESDFMVTLDELSLTDTLAVRGWFTTFAGKRDNDRRAVFVVKREDSSDIAGNAGKSRKARKDIKEAAFSTERTFRFDIDAALGNGCVRTGFRTRIPEEDLKGMSGIYRVGLAVSRRFGLGWNVKWLDRTIDFGPES